MVKPTPMPDLAPPAHKIASSVVLVPEPRVQDNIEHAKTGQNTSATNYDAVDEDCCLIVISTLQYSCPPVLQF